MGITRQTCFVKENIKNYRMKTLDQEKLKSVDIVGKWVICIEDCQDEVGSKSYIKNEKYKVTNWYDDTSSQDSRYIKLFGTAHSSYTTQKKFFVTEKEFIIEEFSIIKEFTPEKSLTTRYSIDPVNNTLILIDNLIDTSDERIFQNFTEELIFINFSKINGAPIFKLTDKGKEMKFLEELQKFETEDETFKPKIKYVSSLSLEDHVYSGQI